MIGPVRRTLLLSILSFVAMGVVGSGICASAGAVTSHSRPLCTALKPGVQAGQRIPLTAAATSSQTLAKSKKDLLADINVVLQTLNSVKPQMRSAPAGLSASFDRVVAVDAKLQEGGAASIHEAPDHFGVPSLRVIHRKGRDLRRLRSVSMQGSAPVP